MTVDELLAELTAASEAGQGQLDVLLDGDPRGLAFAERTKLTIPNHGFVQGQTFFVIGAG